MCLDTNGNQSIVAIPMILLKRRAKKLGYPFLRFHDLRHSHATIAIHEEGAKPDSVQVRLGHSDVSTTLSIYTAKSAEQDAKIAEAFDF